MRTPLFTNLQGTFLLARNMLPGRQRAPALACLWTQLTVPGQHRHCMAGWQRTTQYLGRETVPRWVCERFSQELTMCTSVQTDIVSFTIIHDLLRAHGST
jgi:hypothetical protein